MLGHPRLGAGQRVLDPLAQLGEAGLEPGGVGDEVALVASPSTATWLARSRRSLTASTMQKISAISAEAAGGQGDDPLVVVVRSSGKAGSG